MITSKLFTSHNQAVASRGFVLPLVLVGIIILMALIVGATMTDYHTRLQAVQNKSQTEAMLAAEAGYERAIFWMSQQSDILGAIQEGADSGNLDFGTSTCEYGIDFHGYIGARPVFRVVSTGTSGRPSFTKVVDVDVVQETSGWAMGKCQVPYTATTTGEVIFANGEIITMPLHINNLGDSPDDRDIYITGSPQFRRKVEMGESRKTSGGTDKYSGVMTCFQDGIAFDQPNVRITDTAAVQSKIERFRQSTLAAFRFEPNGVANVYTPSTANVEMTRLSAVQLEFYKVGTAGKVRITNNCTVLGYRRTSDSKTWDFNSVGSSFSKYYIYAYHFAPDYNYFPPVEVNIGDTYTTQSFGGYTSESGGQIYVNGNVIIGGCSTTDPNQIVKGKISVVATGNIWIADSIHVDGDHDANGMPVVDDPDTVVDEGNPNVLGLIAKGVVKVVDPGMSTWGSTNSPGPSPNYYPADANGTACSTKIGSTVYTGAGKNHYYVPIGNGASIFNPNRTLPHNTVVEAAITCGGGGWGAENVQRISGSTTYGGRKEYSAGVQDNIIVHGSIQEVLRGVVGIGGSPPDGYLKQYVIDLRLMSGILPGDIWFSGKYIPAPAGWHDHSPD
jgi:hypothetical protein